MNYFSHYEKMMSRARNRVLDGYCEKHHAIPRCMGGEDSKENIVRLTPEEHYVAHQLLIKMYPENRRLAHAANMMATRCSTNKAFGWIRRHLGFKHSKEERARQSERLKGRVFTPEWRAKISAAAKGRKRNWKPSPEFSSALAARNKARGQSAETREKIAASKRGKKMPPMSEETRIKRGLAFKGRKHSSESIAKFVEISKRRIRDKAGHIIGLREGL